MQRQNPHGAQPNPNEDPAPRSRIIKRETALSGQVEPGAALPKPTASADRPKGLRLPSRHGQDAPMTAAQESSQAPEEYAPKPPAQPFPAIPHTPPDEPPSLYDFAPPPPAPPPVQHTTRQAGGYQPRPTRPVGSGPPAGSVPSKQPLTPPETAPFAGLDGRQAAPRIHALPANRPEAGLRPDEEELELELELDPAVSESAEVDRELHAGSELDLGQEVECDYIELENLDENITVEVELEERAPEENLTLTQTTASPRHQLEAWLAMMVQKKASDLILRAGGRPCVRIDGRIHWMPGRVPGPGALLEVLEGIVGKKRLEAMAETGSADVALDMDALGRFRLNAYRQMGDPAVVLRRIAEDPPDLEALNLPTRELHALARRKRGIILVTGIAGSGKSTTLAGMIQYMNQNTERHIITLEDPVEMIFKEERCVISQREVGTDCSNFSDGLRHSLRQSPDVILIGEMRDAETINAALDATETGHLVMSTLHTVNAPQTVDRILSFFRSEQHQAVRQRLAENLGAVLSQRLLPFVNGQGMVPAIELMSSTPRVRELLETGRTAELSRVIEQGGEEGLISFNQSLRVLVTTGCVDLETALAASDRPDELLLALRGYTNGGERRKQNREGGGPAGGWRMAGGQ